MKLRLFLLINLHFFLTGCAGLLYYPTRTLYVDPQKLNPAPELVKFELNKNIEIHGWRFKTIKPPARAVILFFHGNGGNRSGHFTTLYWIIKHGYDLVIFDYPGYGQTRGDPTPESTVQMGKAALRYVHAQYPSLPLVVYGQSLGGAVAMRSVWEMRQEIPTQLLIVDSSFLSYKRAARRVMAKSWLTWALQPLAYILFSDRWAPGKKVAELSGIPLIVIHSRTDEIIPFDLGEEIYNTAREPKEFWIKERGTHNEPFAGEDGPALQARLLQALEKYLSR